MTEAERALLLEVAKDLAALIRTVGVQETSQTFQKLLLATARVMGEMKERQT